MYFFQCSHQGELAHVPGGPKLLSLTHLPCAVTSPSRARPSGTLSVCFGALTLEALLPSH